jgi:hypothetical protein
MSIDVSLVFCYFWNKGLPIADVLDQLSPVVDVGSYDGMKGEKQSPYKLLVSYRQHQDILLYPLLTTVGHFSRST